MPFDARKFAQSARDAGYSDDEIVAKIREHQTPSYKLTDYAGEAAKLPAPAPSGPEPVDDSGDNAVSRFIHRAIPETRMFKDAAGRTVPAPDDPIAHDPLAQMVIANQLGWGAGKLLAPAGRIISGGGNAATQTAAMGGTPEDIVKGGVIGAAIPAAGMAMGKAARMVREGAGGQARALWEKHGGNVGPLDSGSGVSEIAGIEPSRAGVGEAGAIGAKNIRAGLKQDFEAQTGKPYREMTEKVDYSPAARELVDVSSLRGTIADRLYSEKTPRSVRGWLRTELDSLDAMRSPDGRVMVPQSRLNEMRQRLSKEADYGINTGAGTANIKDQSIKDIANAAKVLVDEGPYAEPNALYARGMERQATDRAALGLKDTPAWKMSGRAAEDARVSRVLRSAGNDSEAAGDLAARTDIPGLIERHPDLARQVDLPALVRAKDRLSFGLEGGATDNLIQAASKHGIGGKAVELIRHNLDAAAGRLAYRPAGLGLVGENVLTSPEMAQITANYARPNNPIIQAYLQAQQRDKERAAALNAK